MENVHIYMLFQTSGSDKHHTLTRLLGRPQPQMFPPGSPKSVYIGEQKS